MSDDIRAVMKAIIWEEAKSKLRALVAIQGSYFASGADADHVAIRLQACNEAVEAFVKEMEDSALVE